MSVHSISLKGLREQNEDQHDIILNRNGKNSSMSRVNLFAVYDGHGGKAVSKFLKENLSQHFLKTNVEYPLKSEYVNAVYDHLQKELKDPKRNGVAHHTGSTALVAIDYNIENDHLLSIMNTGDSRCILCRDDLAISLTLDHKPSWPRENSRISQLGGVIAFDGFDWRIGDLSVSRAFGDIDATPYVTHRPDIYKYKLSKKDKFIVLGCDGLWDVLSNQQVVNFVLSNCYDSKLESRINREVNIADQLAKFAIKSGSTDNVSIIVYFFD
jgi:serine/threonine protein phosphatase PrpC